MHKTGDKVSDKVAMQTRFGPWGAYPPMFVGETGNTSTMPDTQRTLSEQNPVVLRQAKAVLCWRDSGLVDEPLPSFPGPSGAPSSSESFRSCSFFQTGRKVSVVGRRTELFRQR